MISNNKLRKIIKWTLIVIILIPVFAFISSLLQYL